MFTRSQEGALDVRDDLSFDLEFPPLPQTVSRVNALLQESGQTSITELADTVEQDPTISSKVLQRVNSVYYGLRRHVGEIRKAVTFLGFEEIYDMVHTANLIQLGELFASDEAERVFYQITRNAVATAGFTRLLADELNFPHAEQAYTCGLLHTIGQLVLLYNVPSSYEGLWNEAGHLKKPNPEKERFLFGVDYADLGAVAAEKWRFPRSHRQAIRYHIAPRDAAEDCETLAYAVSTGWHVSKQLLGENGPSEQRRYAPYCEGLNQLAERTDATLNELQELLCSQVDDIEEFVNMAAPR